MGLCPGSTNRSDRSSFLIRMCLPRDRCCFVGVGWNGGWQAQVSSCISFLSFFCLLVLSLTSELLCKHCASIVSGFINLKLSILPSFWKAYKLPLPFRETGISWAFYVPSCFSLSSSHFLPRFLAILLVVSRPPFGGSLGDGGGLDEIGKDVEPLGVRIQLQSIMHED